MLHAHTEWVRYLTFSEGRAENTGKVIGSAAGSSIDFRVNRMMYGKRNHKTSIDTLEIFKSVNFIESMAVKSQNAPLKNEIKP